VDGGQRTTHFEAQKPGPAQVRIDVVDMAGNKGFVTGVITIGR
jgi:hypothetical protein